MLATLGGLLALLLGLAILLLPLLTPELSRPRDAAWGALVLLLGLDLVTSADRLSGAPMLGVLCAGLLIGRLGSEVGRARWTMLTPEERQQLRSAARWQRSLDQLAAAFSGLLAQAQAVLAGLGSTLGGLGGGKPARAGGSGSGKRWVRPDIPTAAPAERELAASEAEPAEAALAEAAPDAAAPDPAAAPSASGAAAPPPPTDQLAEPGAGAGEPASAPVREVEDFSAIEALLIESGGLSPGPAAATQDGTGGGEGAAAGIGDAPDPDQPAAGGAG